MIYRKVEFHHVSTHSINKMVPRTRILQPYRSLRSSFNSNTAPSCKIRRSLCLRIGQPREPHPSLGQDEPRPSSKCSGSFVHAPRPLDVVHGLCPIVPESEHDWSACGVMPFVPCRRRVPPPGDVSTTDAKGIS